MRILLCIVFTVISIKTWSQETERVPTQGKIFVPKGEEREGVHIYNISTEKGTVSNAEGMFTIAVAPQDRLQITSIQYQSFTVVVTPSAIDEGLLKIYLHPHINTLDEVLLSQYKLTGDLEKDAQNVDVVAVPDIELSYDADADFSPDRFSRIQGNVAQEALGYGNMKNGVNFVALFGVLADALFPKKKSKPQPYVNSLENKDDLIRALQEKFSTEFYSTTFGIPTQKVDDFIYFAEENAVTWKLLKPENEIELLEVLLAQSKLYLAR